MCDRITLQLVGHQSAAAATLPLDKSTEKPYRRFDITPRLDEHGDNISVLVAGAADPGRDPAGAQNQPRTLTANVLAEGGKVTVQLLAAFSVNGMNSPVS